MKHPLLQRIDKAVEGDGVAHFDREEIARLGTILNDAGLATAFDLETNPKLTATGVYGYRWGVVIQEAPAHAL